jgi:PAS domain S-box-containing protein
MSGTTNQTGHEAPWDASQLGELHRVLFEESADGIFIADPRGRHVAVNHRGAGLTGYGREELLGMSIADLILPEDPPRSLSRMDELRLGRMAPGERRIRRKDGRLMPVEVSSRELPGGNRLYVLRVIAEDKRAVEALRESEALYRMLFEANPQPMWVYDLETLAFLEVNDAALARYGYSRDEFLAMTIADIRPAEDLPRLRENIARVGAQPLDKAGIWQYCTKDGTVIDVEITSHVLNFGGRRAELVLASDVTERRRAEENLAHSHGLLSYIIEHTNSAVAVHDRELRYIYVSQRYLDQYKVKERDVIGKHHYDVFPDLPQKWRDVHQRALAGEVSSADRDPYCRADGTVEWTRWECRPWYEADGAIGGIIVYTEVITDRVRAEETRAELSRLLEESLNEIYVFDADTLNFVLVNSGARKNLGYTMAELHSMTPVDLKPEISLAALEELIRPLRSGAASKTIFETRHQRKDQSLYDVEVHVQKATLEGRPVFVAIIIDITERKRAEEELRKSHQTFLTVLDGIDATVYVADLDTYEILFMNKHMIDAFGGDLTGRTCYEAFRGESSPCGHCTNDRLLDAEGNPADVCVWETKNPLTGKWYINHDRAIRWGDSRMVRLQIATDISRFKELEQERLRIEEQLRQAQKMESVGRLAGGVAHDFNNMLSAILGHAELAMMQFKLDEPILDDLMAIKKATQRSADLVRQLLAFARKQTVAPKVLDLNDIVAGMLKMLQRLIGEDIDLVWKPGAELWTVKIDPSQIDQILANLCVNARDAIAGVGKVTIESENTTFDEDYCAVHPGAVCGEYVMLAVSDDGCGMTKEVIDHIFEPFFTTKELGKGTGLGLATVYGIVKQNEGFANVYSEPEKGTTFKIYLPRFVGEATVPAPEGLEEIHRGDGEMVLVVEDEAAILRVARAMLERLGYAVVTAGTPGEALRQAEAHAAEIRLLITDVIMPEMNGRDLVKRISRITPGLKCLFTSGYTANVIAHHGVLEEGVQFLQKPFTLKDLAFRVCQALASG